MEGEGEREIDRWMDGWIDRYPHYITIGFAKFLFIYTVYIYMGRLCWDLTATSLE